MSLPTSSKVHVPTVAHESQGEEGDYLTTFLRMEMFTIDILKIKEIPRYSQLTVCIPLPLSKILVDAKQ